MIKYKAMWTIQQSLSDCEKKYWLVNNLPVEHLKRNPPHFPDY